MGIADRDYMYTRREPVSRSAPPPRGGGLSRLASTATILSVIAAVATRLVSVYGIPSFDRPAGPILSFPNSGDVFVTPYADLQHGQSRFRVQVPPADHSNYVVLLTNAVSRRRIMAIYCRSGDDVTVPVPPLTYRVRVASGLDWYGLHDLFGRGTHVEEVGPNMVAAVGRGTGIEFRRRPDGNLPTHTAPKSRFSGDL